MSTIRSPEQAVRKRLTAYLNEEREIDNQIERIENLEEKITGIQSPDLSGMPKGQNVSKDRMLKMVAEKLELEREVRAMIDHHEQESAWIKRTVKRIKKPDERACIRMRYLDMEGWGKVSKMLYGAKKDYHLRTDSYIRRTTKLHGRAIKSMACCLAEKEG